VDQSEIYETIKNSFAEQTGKVPADDGSLGIRMALVAGEIAKLYDRLEEEKKQMFPQTATGIYLDRHGQVRDLTRKGAGAAAGKVTFQKNTPALQDIPIPTGTVCTSSGGGNIMYTTTEDAVLSQGAQRIEVPVKASVTGRIGNISAGKVDRMVTPVAGIDTVTNEADILGGMEEEDDNQFRKRIMDSYVCISNGANLKFYEDIALQHENVWSAKAVTTAGTNQMTLYITDQMRNISDDVCNQVKEMVQNARELNLQVTVEKAQVVTQDISMTLYLDSLQNQMTKYAQAEFYITDYLYNRKIGESFNPYTVAAEMAQQVDGFYEVEFTSPTAMVTVEPSQIIKPGTVNITLKRKEVPR
jgi:uncharacterized phage protein gp47/JayE